MFTARGAPTSLKYNNVKTLIKSGGKKKKHEHPHKFSRQTGDSLLYVSTSFSLLELITKADGSRKAVGDLTITSLFGCPAAVAAGHRFSGWGRNHQPQR